MADVKNTEYLGKHKKFRIDSRKLAATFIILAFLVAIVVFWWLKLVGITVTGDAFCGFAEHTHSDNCYVSQLICGYDEETTETSGSTSVSEETASEETNTAETEDTTEENTSEGVSEAAEETTEITTAATEESTETESHIHTDECYTVTLICEKAEHTHSQDCYPDYSADVEAEGDWLSTMEDVELTDNAAENLLLIANTQLGYTESSLNFEYDEDGNKRGYTRYGEWYGNPYGNWNAMFVSFCLKYGNVEGVDSLISSGAESMLLKWQASELVDSDPSHEIKVGELLFVDSDSNEVADTVLIVSQIEEKENNEETYIEIRAITGDSNNCVEEIVLEDTENVIGYGLTGLIDVIKEEESTTETTTEETTTETEETTTLAAEETTDETVTKDSEAEDSKAQQTTKEAETTAEEKTTEEEAAEETTVGDTTEDNGLSVVGIAGLPQSEIEAYIAKVTQAFDALPSYEEFENKIIGFEDKEDYEGEEAYLTELKQQCIDAYQLYLILDGYKDEVENSYKLFDLETLWNVSVLPTEGEPAITVYTVNSYAGILNNVAPSIMFYGGSGTDYGKSGFGWWIAIVVEEHEDGYLYVSQTDFNDNNTYDKAKYEAETSDGFVLIVHATDSTNYVNAKKVLVGDEVVVDFDYKNASTGYKSSGYGTVTFREYVEPEPDPEPEPDEPAGEPTVEDIPLESIQDGDFSDPQVLEAGGKVTSAEGDVQISKSINGTDIENVFDITLTVRTETSVQTYLAEPDMAVVVVMDISNTMNSYYPTGQTSTTRYDAAVEAAENFMNQFAAETAGISQLGFVAFNTHAHEILALQPCTTDNVAEMIQTMKDETDEIVSASGYADSHDRFTNVEAGLKRGYDMLASSGNANQYIIFLSDGFPTTYLKSGTTTYEGYDPYTSSGTKGSDGVFYDYVQQKYCSLGTSYSDKAAIRAREMATLIKENANIFSIGIDIGGQKIQTYADATLSSDFSIVDRTGTTYEIGDATKATAYQEWLRTSIGSGYYYDSTAKDDIANAFDDIFTKIKAMNEQSRYTVWTSTDPLPVFDENSSIVEFIHFYDLEDEAAASLTGKLGEGFENTAYHSDSTIYWDLKASGYEKTEETVDEVTKTYYFYSLTYRVRLYNEAAQFEEYWPYETNGEAKLEYKTIVNTNGVNTISELKTLEYPKPVVEGYYADFTFLKQSDLGDPLAGAEFSLTHDNELCSICHGNNKPVTTVSVLGPFTSTADGSVSFTKIPSGHIYTLSEDVFPEGYTDSGKIYKVTISMDKISVMIYESEEDTVGTLWEGDGLEIINPPFVYILPETGGIGTLPFTIIGLTLMAFPILYNIIRRKRERRSC